MPWWHAHERLAERDDVRCAQLTRRALWARPWWCRVCRAPRIATSRGRRRASNVHAGLPLRRGPAAPVPCSCGGTTTGWVSSTPLVACRSAWDAGLRRGVISPSRARQTPASVMPFPGYARQSCPSPRMRVSHALHWICASVMPLTGYARQSCLAQGYAHQPRPAQCSGRLDSHGIRAAGHRYGSTLHAQAASHVHSAAGRARQARTILNVPSAARRTTRGAPCR